MQDLRKKYNLSYESYHVSCWKFFNLCPFYVRSVTNRDVELCCCKLHLHGHRSIAALFGSIKKHGLHSVEFNDYYSFFKYLTADCPKDNYENVFCQCTPDKISFCPEILSR